MAVRRKSLTLIVLLFCSVGCCFAQATERELPQRARAMQLGLALPSIDDVRFDTAAVGEGQGAYDMRWRERHGRFELRFRMVPDSALGRATPNVVSGSLATHLARNTEEDIVGRFRPGTEDLDRLGADWAYFWDYVPKRDWANGYAHCYQVSYFREGLGLVHGWLLYDATELRESPWVYALPFSE